MCSQQAFCKRDNNLQQCCYYIKFLQDCHSQPVKKVFSRQSCIKQGYYFINLLQGCHPNVDKLILQDVNKLLEQLKTSPYITSTLSVGCYNLKHPVGLVQLQLMTFLGSQNDVSRRSPHKLRRTPLWTT